MPPTAPTGRRVALVTLGCGRNEVDSEELAGRLAADGWLLVPEAADADVAVVNTCGFVEAAKKDSVDTLLAAADLKGGGAPRPSWRSAASPSGTASSSRQRCPRPTRCWASTTTPTSRPGSAASSTATRTCRTCPATGARCCRSPRPTGRPAHTPARPDLPDGVAPASGPQPLRMRLGDGPAARAQARLRLRPALHLLRDPHLPRLVRVPAAARGARRGAPGWPGRGSARSSW